MLQKGVLGGICWLCTTRSADLVTCLPQINSQFQQGQQQCAAEFFQEFCCVQGHTANQYQRENLIPASCNLSFLRLFLIELQSEVMCSTCQNVISNSTKETSYQCTSQRYVFTAPQGSASQWMPVESLDSSQKGCIQRFSLFCNSSSCSAHHCWIL